MNSGKVTTTPARKPSWLTVKPFGGEEYRRVTALLGNLGLHTVCQEANCPNRGECFNRGTAVFLLMGPTCTRNCRFCDVRPGMPKPLDPNEPARVAAAASALALRHVVITSVTRDDLADGGAAHFASTVREVRSKLPACTIEVLTPDFRGSDTALATVMQSSPDIFNHNIETVPRLYASIRPAANYHQSLELLHRARHSHNACTKSGLMVGLGETAEELKQVFKELADTGVSILTIGQYLAPSREHYPIARYYHPDEFVQLETWARESGIGTVVSGPLVRSSYFADVIAERL
ncbi:MAG: lipoyl synthase [Candidatus Zixiibacteriota bacterium]